MITTSQMLLDQQQAELNKNAASQGLANTPQEAAVQKMMAALKAGLANPPTVGGTPGTATPPGQVAPPTVTPSTSAGQAFAQSKDASSRITNKALDALRSQMVSRGIEGSGVEGRETANILGQAATQQSQGAYDALKTDEERSWDAAKMGYEGAITQRGQDIGLTEAGYQNQYYQQAAQNQQMQMLIALMSAMGGGY